jgi:hypothetical protein
MNNIIRKKREFFFGPAGSSYNKFSSMNRPNEATFRRLFYSIPFFMESESTAKETSQGLVRLSKDDDAFNRNTISSDGFARAVQPHQLPSIKRKDSVKNILKITEANSADNRTGGTGSNILLSSYEFVGDGVGIDVDHVNEKITFSYVPINQDDISVYIDDALQIYMTNSEVGNAFVSTSIFNNSIANINSNITSIKDLQGNFADVPIALGNTISKALINLNTAVGSASSEANQNTQAITGLNQSIAQIYTSINQLLVNQADVSNFESRLNEVEAKAIPISVWQTTAGNVADMHRSYNEHYFTFYEEISTNSNGRLVKTASIPSNVANNMDIISIVSDFTFNPSSGVNKIKLMIQQGTENIEIEVNDNQTGDRQILEAYFESDDEGSVLYYAYEHGLNRDSKMIAEGKSETINLSQEFNIHLIALISDSTKQITFGKFLGSVQHRPITSGADITVQSTTIEYDPVMYQ